MLYAVEQDASKKRPDLNNLNTAALAYIGDAVYELAVRERILSSGTVRADRLHKTATAYVCAPGQARVIHAIFGDLTEEEQRRVKRYRNFRNHSRAKNTDVMTYSWATAFEALAGYLYLAGDSERLEWLLDRAFAVIEGKREKSHVIRKEETE